jgi:hypothetical protein
MKLCLIMAIVHICSQIALFFLARKFLKYAKYYANIQTLLIVFFCLEGNIISGKYIESSDGWTIIISMMAFLQTFTYSQLDSIFVFIICLIYSFTRSYFWIDSSFRWMKFNIYLVASYFTMIIFSRAFH